jgi:hypothetical protein
MFTSLSALPPSRQLLESIRFTRPSRSFVGCPNARTSGIRINHNSLAVDDPGSLAEITHSKDDKFSEAVKGNYRANV